MSVDYYSIGLRIKYHRKLRGLTQAELAEKVELSERQIIFIESGSRGISLDKLIEIADALKVSASDLLVDNIEVDKKDLLSLMMGCTKSELNLLKKIIDHFEDIINNLDI